MEIIDNPNFKNFENSCLIVKSKPRFALPYGMDELVKSLNLAYRSEVALRNGKMETGVQFDTNLRAVAEWLSDGGGRVGLLLYGTVGTGKTTMMLALCRVVNFFARPDYGELTLNNTYRKVINVIRAKDVVEAYQNDRQLYDTMCKVELLAIDEFGVEAIDVKSFGNSNEPIIDLLSMRYDRRRCTVISSNLDLDEIRSRYGLRLQDRFVEMFKMVAFTGKSYRK